MPNQSLDDQHHDGIEELDNPLPKWWVYLFYATIIFAIGYGPYYWLGKGQTAVQVLANEQAKTQSSANGEATDLGKKLTAAAQNHEVLEAGQVIFTAKCAACHGPDGGGIIGPNLTDKFWIHGKGTANDIAHVVSEGVPDKGMLAWGKVLSPDDLVAVVTYVHSLADTSPDHPKAPEGTPIN